MKFVHAADLHLDSPMRGLSRYEGAPVERIRLATRHAFENLVDLCLEESASLLLLAGDIFDGDWRDFATGLFFVGQLNRLRETNTEVVLLHGNHDAASPITRDLMLPSHIHLLPGGAPESFELGPYGVHGQSFKKREVLEDLASSYPDPIPGAFNIGLLHTALSGRPDHAPYAPTRVEVLRGRGYHYWALGHVHQREVVDEDPWIVFPGNLQGRNIREVGAKGATLVTHSESEVLALEHRALDVVRWAKIHVDVTTDTDRTSAIERARPALERALEEAEDRLLAARITFTGQLKHIPKDRQERESFESNLRLQASDLGDVWVERVVWNTSDAADTLSHLEVEALDSVFHEVLEGFRGAQDDPETLEALSRELQDLDRGLPREATEGDAAVRPGDPNYLRESLDEAARSLLLHLTQHASSDSDSPAPAKRPGTKPERPS